MESNKVIMFPTDRQAVDKLLTRSNELMAKEKFHDALTILTYLESQNVQHPHLFKNLMICYIATHRLIDAQLLCEHLLEQKDAFYYEYVQFYFYILFERKKYRFLIDSIDKERPHLPEELKESVRSLYTLAKEALQEEVASIENELQTVMMGKDYTKQIATFEKWCKLGVEPTPFIKSLLGKEHVQPAVKTYIIELLLNARRDEAVTVEKFGFKDTFNLTELHLFNEHPIYKQTLEQLTKTEHHAPSVAQLQNELYEQFMYVIYPFYYPEEHISSVVQAIKHITEQQMAIEPTKDVNDPITNSYIEQIAVLASFYIPFS